MTIKAKEKAKANPKKLPNKLTPKQEAFAQAYVKCLSCSEAYRQSYSPKTMTHKTLQEEACRTGRLPGVSTRIVELQGKLIKETKIEMHWFFEQLLTNYREAHEKGDQRHALRTLEVLGKHLGLDKIDTELLEKIILVTPENGRVKKATSTPK